jgi:hypothetical protein
MTGEWGDRGDKWRLVFLSKKAELLAPRPGDLGEDHRSARDWGDAGRGISGRCFYIIFFELLSPLIPEMGLWGPRETGCCVTRTPDFPPETHPLDTPVDGG